MYNLSNAKLMILPDWLCEALKAHNLQPKDVLTVEGLRSILSADDVNYYLSQVEKLMHIGIGTRPTYPAIQTVLDSFNVAHTNSGHHKPLRSGLETPVKINTLYGSDFTHYDFFNSLAGMNEYLPRRFAASLQDNALVDPYVEFASSDLFVLKFTTGLYSGVEDQAQYGIPNKGKLFVRNVLDLMLGNYGFDEAVKTDLFELYTLTP